MNFTVKQLKAFVMVAETANFRIASELLFLTPAAVSMLVKDLEEALGFFVFERTTRKVDLTRQGKAFLPCAENLLKEIEKADNKAKEILHESNAVVRIAAPLIIASLILPQVISDYMKINDSIKIEIIDANLHDLLHSIEIDAADISLGTERPLTDAVNVEYLFQTPWCVWFSKHHPFAGCEHVNWAQLQSERIIAAGAETGLKLKAMFAANPDLKSLAVHTVVDNVTTALGMVSEDFGVAIAPGYVNVLAKLLGLSPGALLVPGSSRNIALFRSSKRPMSPATRDFHDWLVARFQRQGF